MVINFAVFVKIFYIVIDDLMLFKLRGKKCIATNCLMYFWVLNLNPTEITKIVILWFRFRSKIKTFHGMQLLPPL